MIQFLQWFARHFPQPYSVTPVSTFEKPERSTTPGATSTATSGKPLDLVPSSSAMTDRNRPLVSTRLAEFVGVWEGFSATAYRCSANVWTIGYGTTEGVKSGDTITRAEALIRLTEHLEEDARNVDRVVGVPLLSYERDALISLVYNIGRAAFSRSTLLRLLNAGDKAEAAEQFLRWNRAGGRVVLGLVKRRTAERSLFLFSDYSGAP
jgi:lysozyme